jgi:hypothetical protein
MSLTDIEAVPEIEDVANIEAITTVLDPTSNELSSDIAIA